MSTIYAPLASLASSCRRRRVLIAAGVIILIFGLGYGFGYLAPQRRILGDGFWPYDPLAPNLLTGHGIPMNIAPPHQPSICDVPGYPMLVAAINAVSHAASHDLAIAQILVEFLILGVVYRALKLTGASHRGAWTAVALGWLRPNPAIRCRQTYSDLLASLVITILLLLLIHFWSRPTPDPARPGLLVGASAGVTVLVGVDAFPITAVAGIALPGTSGPAIRRWSTLFDAHTLGFLQLVLLWNIRHYRPTGQHLPQGWQQYTQARDPYRRWLNTCLDDPNFTLIYSLHRGAPDAVRTNPADRVSNSDEPLVTVTELCLTMSTQFRMRLRRTAKVWVKLPSIADVLGEAITQAGKHATRSLLLLGAAVALVFGVARRQWWLIGALGIRARRMAGALGTDIWYQYRALPTFYILPGFGEAAQAGIRHE